MQRRGPETIMKITFTTSCACDCRTHSSKNLYIFLENLRTRIDRDCPFALPSAL